MPEYTVTLPAVYGGNRSFYHCHDAEAVLHGPSDTGKTMAALAKVHCLAWKHKDASIVILRKRLTDTFSTVIRTFTEKVAHRELETGAVTAYGGEKPEWFDYPTGSRVWVSGLDKAGKILGAEHDLILVSQLEEWSLPDWEVLTTRVTGRAGHVPHPQVIGDCNPGAPTHWIKSRAREGRLTLFESTHRDNPEIFDPATGELTEGGATRLARLRNLTGSRYQRLFLGLWAAPEGAIYDVFEETKHKVKAFSPPALWPRVVGIDPVGVYVAAIWLAYDPAAKVLNAYREYYGEFGATTPGHVDNIRRLSSGETIFAWVGGGPSERQARTDFAGAGIPLLPPPAIGVWAQIDRVYQLLKDFKLVIHDSCPQLLSEIGSYRRKLKDGVPTEEIEAKETYHGLDCVRGAVSWLAEPSIGQQVVYDPVRIGRW
jgi:phage terminase large subunit